MNGVEVARRAFSGTDPKALSGTLVALPILNADGFRHGSRYLSDRRDLNRYWPGSETGSVASFIANAVFTEVIARCDALIDLHTASFRRTNQPQIRVNGENSQSLDLATHFNEAVIVLGQGPSGSLRRAAVDAGVPAIIYEAGEPMRFQPAKIEPGVIGVHNVMGYLGMLERPPFELSDSRIFGRSTWTRVPPRAGGFFFPEVGLGDKVTRGQELGYIIDPLTDLITTIKAHRTGEVIGLAVPQPVLTGYALFHIGVGGEDVP